MRISDKRRSELYSAIHEPIMQQRISNAQEEEDKYTPHFSINEVDKILFDLTDDIWKEVHKTLGLKGPA